MRDIELCRQHFSRECVIYSGLGTTEAGNICQYFIDCDSEFAGDRVPVGYSAPGATVLLLDDHGKPVEADQIGEVAVTSRYLTCGYWQRPDLTEARFCPTLKELRTEPTEPEISAFCGRMAASCWWAARTLK